MIEGELCKMQRTHPCGEASAFKGRVMHDWREVLQDAAHQLL